MSANTRSTSGNMTEQDIERLRDEVCKRPAKLIRRAKGGSLTDTVALAHFSPLVHVNFRQDAFSVFLKFLRDAENMFKKIGSQQPEYASFVIKVLLGIGQSESYIKEDKAIAQALAKDWEMIARWVRRFCDNFKSTEDPFPGAFVTYAEWYNALMLTLVLANADRNLSPQLWSVSDAKHALYKLWLLDGPTNLPMRVVPVCSGILGVLILHRNIYGVSVEELFKQTDRGAEELAHLAMTRLIKAAKSGVVDDMRDYAYIVLALVSSSNQSTLCSILLKKKAISYLTKTFVKLADIETIQQDEMHPGFVENYLILFEYITDPNGGYPNILQALRHGFLKGIVNCGCLLDKLQSKAVDVLKHIVGNVMIKYLAYYSFLVGVLNAMREIDHKHIKRCIDPSILEPPWKQFEQYLLERSAYKALFDLSVASDLDTVVCGHTSCGKYGAKDGFQKCAGCENVHYCSKDCQAVHWKSGGHRAVCKSTPEELRGWDKRDRKFIDLIGICDTYRHIKGLHQLAVKKYGLDPIPRFNSQPYGRSIDYSTVPPTLDVFRLEDEPDTANFCVANERLRGVAEEIGVETCIFQTVLPKGSTKCMGQVSQGNLGPPNKHVWEEGFEILERIRALPVRPSGVDRDGALLRVVSDQTDIILSKLTPSKVKVGAHFRWDTCSQLEEGKKANVVDEIDRLMTSMLTDYGKNIMKVDAGRTGSTKGSKEK